MSESMLNLEIHRSIAEVDEGLWDSLSQKDWFHTHRFIASVEEAGLPGSRFWYLLFWDKEKLVGSAVISTYNMALDMFIKDHPVIRKANRLFPCLFTVRILMCGLPASFGQFNCKMLDKCYAEEISRHISEQLEQIASIEKISFLFVKELLQKEVTLFSPYFQNYILAHSIPYMQMDIRWTSFADYLSELRHPYRRSIKRSLQKIGVEEPRIFFGKEFAISELFPVLQLENVSACAPEELYLLYLSVMERTPTKLEVLNLGFFEALFKHMEQDIYLLKVHKGAEIYAIAILLREHKELTFMLLGREEEKDLYDSYFNLVYGILTLAMQWGIKTIKMGQTAYWVKQRVGATPKDQYFFLLIRNRLLHFLLSKLNSTLFPPSRLPDIRVFRHKNIQPQHA